MTEETHTPRLVVTRDSEAGRFELRRHAVDSEDELLSFANYTLDGRVMTLSYVETLLRHRNNDYAAMLMSGILDEVEVWEWQVRPTCSYAASYITDHPDMQYLLAS